MSINPLMQARARIIDGIGVGFEVTITGKFSGTNPNLIRLTQKQGAPRGMVKFEFWQKISDRHPTVDDVDLNDNDEIPRFFEELYQTLESGGLLEKFNNYYETSATAEDFGWKIRDLDIDEIPKVINTHDLVMERIRKDVNSVMTRLIVNKVPAVWLEAHNPLKNMWEKVALIEKCTGSDYLMKNMIRVTRYRHGEPVPDDVFVGELFEDMTRTYITELTAKESLATDLDIQGIHQFSGKSIPDECYVLFVDRSTKRADGVPVDTALEEYLNSLRSYFDNNHIGVTNIEVSCLNEQERSYICICGNYAFVLIFPIEALRLELAVHDVKTKFGHDIILMNISILQSKDYARVKQMAEYITLHMKAMQ